MSGQFVSFLLVISISSPCCFLCLARTQLHNVVLDVFWAIWEYILSTRSQFTLCCFGIVFFLGLWVGELFWVFLEQRINSSKIYWPIKWKIKMFKPYGTFLKEQISDMLLQTFNFFPWACISCDFNWKLLVRVSLFLSTFFFYLIWNVLWSLFVWGFFYEVHCMLMKNESVALLECFVQNLIRIVLKAQWLVPSFWVIKCGHSLELGIIQ